MGIFGSELHTKVEVEGREFRPGDIVRARLTIDCPEAQEVREIYVGLVRHEDLKVKRYEPNRSRPGQQLVTSWDTTRQWLAKEYARWEGMYDWKMPAGLQQTYDFEFSIPDDAPPTFAGDVVRRQWCVQLMIDRQKAMDIGHSTRLKVLLLSPPDPPPPAELTRFSSDAVEMWIWLPRFAYAQGQEVKGRVNVTARKRIVARSVRIELRRFEVVTAGDVENDSSQTPFQVEIASETTFQPGVETAIEFSFLADTFGTPTHATYLCSSRWSLAAVLDIAWAYDHEVVQEISIYDA